MRDEATFSSRHLTADDGIRFGGVNIPEAPYENALVEMDPPEWNAFRRVLNPMFAPAARSSASSRSSRSSPTTRIDAPRRQRVDRLRPRPRQPGARDRRRWRSSDSTLDDWLRFAEPAHEVVYTRPGTPEFQRAVDGQQWMFETLVAAVADRRGRPARRQPLAHRARRRRRPDRSPTSEVVSLLGTIINGGVDTTTALFANAIEHLDRDHDLRDRLVDQPGARPDRDRGVPPLLLAGPGVRPHRRPGHRARGPAPAAGRPRADVLRARRTATHGGVPRRRRVRRRPPAESARRVRHGQAPLHRLHARPRRVRDHARPRPSAASPTSRIDRAATVRYPSLGIVNGYVSMPASRSPRPPVSL